MPYNWIAKGIPRGQAPGDCARRRQIHTFTTPAPGEPGFYRQAVSLSAFRHGKLKGATAEDRRLHRVSCCWAPTMLWYVEPEHEWLANQQNLVRNSVLAKLDERALPRHGHATLYDFYQHIGFDRHARRYTAPPEHLDIAGGITG